MVHGEGGCRGAKVGRLDPVAKEAVAIAARSGRLPGFAGAAFCGAFWSGGHHGPVLISVAVGYRVGSGGRPICGVFVAVR